MRALSNAQVAALAASQITGDGYHNEDGMLRKATSILEWLNANS